VSEAAEDLFAEFLKRAQSHFEGFVEEHKPAEQALRLLFDMKLGGGTDGTASPRHSEVLGVPATRPLLEVPPAGAVDSDTACPWPRPVLHAGSRLGPYVLLDLLGRGSFGEVWRARQENPVLRDEVAVKVLRLEVAADDVVRRFAAERDALARLNHPHIAKVYDAGISSGGEPYVAMEYVPGVPITKYCGKRALGVDERLRLFVKVCRAVHHAHQRGLLHRDIKPSNVLVSEAPDSPHEPRLIDFGIAKALDERRQEAETPYVIQGYFAGTPEYMSPEQADFSELDLDTRTDVYSLGVVLYELLSGALPVPSQLLRRVPPETIAGLLREYPVRRPSENLVDEHLAAPGGHAGRRRETRKLQRSLKDDLDWICLRAIAANREKRYASAIELADDVERHLAHRPVVARPHSLPYVTRKLLRRRRGRFGVAAAVVAVALVGFGAVWMKERQRFTAAIEQAREAVREGTAARTELSGLASSIHGLEAQWSQTRLSVEGIAPEWERDEEIRQWRLVRSARQDTENRFYDAVSVLNQTRDIVPRGAPEHLDVRRVLAGLHWARYQAAVEKGIEPDPDLYRRLVRTHAVPEFSSLLDGAAVVQLTSDPPGASVYCFRYREEDTRLVPLPFHPARGFTGEPYLVVEGVREPSPPRTAPFRPGDRLVSVAGRPVATLRQLAAAVNGLAVSEQVEVRLRRGTEELGGRWTPWQPRSDELAKHTGRLIQPWFQLGVSFAGYPLDAGDGNLLGRTPLEVHLLPGSYLLLLRAEGFADARLPLHASGAAAVRERVHLLRPDEIPPGFVYVPAGPVATGGDRAAYQPFPWGTQRVEGFLIAKHEVTVAEWLEFLNDDEVDFRVDDGGFLLRPPNKPLSVALPARTSLWRDLVTRRWSINPEVKRMKSDWPVMQVSWLAAQEYVSWLTRRPGAPWSLKYRLPTGLEWERAARGVDRRHFVWGDYFVRSSCCSQGGALSGLPDRVGTFPWDESVFGVRDTVGSVAEQTLDSPEESPRSKVYRGGSYDNIDEYYYRLATRNSLLETHLAHRYLGLRVVAELPR
jgi:serine/threonine protein kinase/formylglycine-generating enzyme required for sulfatase activity